MSAQAIPCRIIGKVKATGSPVVTFPAARKSFHQAAQHGVVSPKIAVNAGYITTAEDGTTSVSPSAVRAALKDQYQHMVFGPKAELLVERARLAQTAGCVALVRDAVTSDGEVAFQRVAESPAGADGLAYLAKLARGREDVRVLQTDRPVDWRSHEVVTDGKVTGYADRITETELAAEHPGRVLATVVDALPTPTEPEAAAVGDDEIDERLARLDSVAATAARPQEEQPRPSM